MALSVTLAVLTVWLAIAVSYTTNLPVGFVVGSASAVAYAGGRAAAGLRSNRPGGGGARGMSVGR
jgi:zinc/manganese transport system permease protein